MRSLISFLFLCLIFSCSGNREKGNTTDSTGVASKNYSALTLDDLAKFTPDQRKALDPSAGQYLFAGTRQEVLTGPGWVKVSSSSAKNPESPRKDIPSNWITSHGIYVGMSMDDIEATNGKPFYVQIGESGFAIANWEAGKLAGQGLWVDFEIESGAPDYPFLSSQELRRMQRPLMCKSIAFHPPDWSEPQQQCEGLPGKYPNLSLQKLKDGELEGKEAEELSIMRNEIYARHGYIFKSKDLTEYFSRYKWYQPSYEKVDNMFSFVERTNIGLIEEAEILANPGHPLSKEIRGLPFLLLPLDMQSGMPAGVLLAPEVIGPDGKISEGNKRTLYGLLPDTSRIYGVLWLLEKDDGNVMYMTTFDKQMRYIQTAAVRLYERANCKIESESIVATLDRDWNYNYDYSALQICPTAGADLKSELHNSLSGSIDKDGRMQ